MYLRQTWLKRGLFLGLAFSIIFLARFNSLTISAAKVPAQQSGSLTVDAGKDLGPINPFVYGANHGPWSAPGLDIMPKALESGVTYLRFPAGNWGDENDISEIQLDVYMAFAKKLHAEPTITVRLKGGTPEKAAKMVKYVNIDKQYGVRYWSIGNEPNLFRDYTVEQYNKDWRTYAEAMRAVDPKIIFVGPDISQYPPPGDPGFTTQSNWFRTFLKANGDMVGVASVHRYPFPKVMNGPTTTLPQLMDSAREWDDIIPAMRKDVQESAGHALPIAVTEVNSHWSNSSGGVATPDSFGNAIWWADVLGRLIRQKVDIVAFWTLYTTSDSGTFGMLNRYDVRPTYYVYQLYKQFGSELLQTDSTDTDVTITAAKRSDGALTLMVVNRATDSKSFTLSLSGFSATGPAELWLFDVDHKAEKTGTVDLTSGKLDLPAESASLYIVPGPASQATEAPTQAGG